MKRLSTQIKRKNYQCFFYRDSNPMTRPLVKHLRTRQPIYSGEILIGVIQFSPKINIHIINLNFFLKILRVPMVFQINVQNSNNFLIICYIVKAKPYAFNSITERRWYIERTGWKQPIISSGWIK